MTYYAKKVHVGGKTHLRCGRCQRLNGMLNVSCGWPGCGVRLRRKKPKPKPKPRQGTPERVALEIDKATKMAERWAGEASKAIALWKKWDRRSHVLQKRLERLREERVRKPVVRGITLGDKLVKEDA